MLFDFTVTGTHDILFHADDVEQADLLAEWREDPENTNFSVRGDDRSPAWTWQTYLYHDGERLVWPSANLMVALRWAGAQVLMPNNRRGKTFKELSQNGLLITQEFCEFLNRRRPVPWEAVQALKGLPFRGQKEGAKALGFDLFVKRARVGQAKHVRVRARFREWQVRGQLRVKREEITPEILGRIGEIAGTGGNGDWRPSGKTPGPYGQAVWAFKRAD
jgi:hypothetical protein